MYQITELGSHLLVEFQAKVTLQTIFSALYEIIQHPEYSRMNDIWVFGDTPVFLSQDDLTAIVQEIEKVYPQEAQRDKTALVAGSGFNKFLAEYFEGFTHRLPYQIKVFGALQEAKKWVA